jgi:hypothetical protein
VGSRLAICLNDHLACATVGLELGPRLRGSNRDSPEFGRPLSEICAEWSLDQQSRGGEPAGTGEQSDPHSAL